MVKGLYTAYTGMVNEQRRLDILSNNLANSTTTGYKKEGTTSSAFASKLAIKIKDQSDFLIPRQLGLINMGVKIGEVYTDHSQGSFQVTDRQSDIGIDGNGFFAIEFTDKAGNTSIKYTRDGEFTVDNQGYFRTSNGDYLLTRAAGLAGNTGAAAHLRVNPLLEYTIDQTGNVWQNDAIVGQVGVVDINDYAYISKYGENYYEIIEGGGVVASNARIEQGCLEASNVNIVEEMVSMIAIQRAYEAGQKVIQTEDQTIEMAVNQVGKV